MTLINNHVLLPFTAQWMRSPEWQRAWQNEIADGVLGNETRVALRAQPRRSLMFGLTNLSLPELGELNEAVLAAKKLGLACAPCHGRGYTLMADVVGDTVTLERNWNASFAPYLFLQNAAGAFEVRAITEVVANVLTLDAEVARAYRAGSFCWSLIFGKFSGDTQDVITPRFGPLKVTIQELVSPEAIQLGDLTPSDDEGIGAMTVGDDFEVGLT